MDDEDLALGDPALVEIAISEVRSVSERSRALHLLGTLPTAPVTVMAVVGPAEAGPELVRQLATPGRWARWAHLGSVQVIAVSGPVERPLAPPKNTRVGVGICVDACD
ncbi:hypothetical protein ACWELQ_44770, partial [Nocardia sp. NPDC004722]